MYSNIKKTKNKIIILNRRNHFVMATMFAFAMVFIFSLISSKAYAACSGDINMGANSITNVGSITFSSGHTISEPDYATFYASGTGDASVGPTNVVPFDTKLGDPNNIFSIASGVITVAKDGIYSITSSVFSNTNREFDAGIYCNGTIKGYSKSYDYGEVTIRAICPLNNGQTIDTRAMTGNILYTRNKGTTFNGTKAASATTVIRLN